MTFYIYTINFFLLFIFYLQAARLTSRCQQLRRLGLNVGHRPFAYHNTHQLLLDSFVQYTSITRYRASVISVRSSVSLRNNIPVYLDM